MPFANRIGFPPIKTHKKWFAFTLQWTNVAGWLENHHFCFNRSYIFKWCFTIVMVVSQRCMNSGDPTIGRTFASGVHNALQLPSLPLSLRICMWRPGIAAFFCLFCTAWLFVCLDVNHTSLYIVCMLIHDVFFFLDSGQYCCKLADLGFGTFQISFWN